MDAKEFKSILIDLGQRKITDDEVRTILSEHDSNADGVLSWSEFVDMMSKIKGTDDSKFGSVSVDKSGKAVATTEGEHGGKHTYSIEERGTFARLINFSLADDEDLADRLPMKDEDETLFHSFDNGVLLCKLMMKIDPNCIDARAINKGQQMNVYQVKENIQMGIAAAKALGIKLIGINSSDFINKVPHMILTCIWQALRILSAKLVNLQETPELFRLCNEGETIDDLKKLSPEAILIRWVNFHLEKAGQERRIKNLGKDLADSEALFYVLNQLGADKCPLDGHDDADHIKRAEKMILNSTALGVPEIVKPADICNGNVKVNTLFVAQIFNTKHGLEELTEEEYKAAGLDDDDVEGTKEERTFRLWINSLNLEDVMVNNLFTDFNDGILLCKIIHKINPSAVNWKLVDMAPDNDFKKNINNNAGVDACKKGLGLKMIGIGGVDLTKGHKKTILACVWQLVRLHYLQLIGNKSEDDLSKWGNELVGDKAPAIKNLKDKSMGSGVYLMHLLSAIEPRAVNWDIMTAGESDEDKEMNCKYVISVARKLGAVIFGVWEDIVNVNSK